MNTKMISKFLSRTAMVIITGGSSGIGAAFIKLILESCPEIIICNLSRSAPKEQSPRLFHISCDLSDSDALAQGCEAVKSKIQEKGTDGELLLINNSGFGVYGRLQEVSRREQLNMIDLNIRAMVDLTMRLLPELQKKGGAVINIASILAFIPMPYFSVYSGSHITREK